MFGAIQTGESWLMLLEFDFPDIDDVIPFGPMNFWSAWYVDLDHYGYDTKEFWLDSAHKWTPVPTCSPVPPTPASTSSATPRPMVAGGFVIHGHDCWKNAIRSRWDIPSGISGWGWR